MNEDDDGKFIPEVEPDPIIDPKKRRVVIAERLLLQCRNKNEVIQQLMEQFKCGSATAGKICKEAEDSIVDSVQIDKDRNRKVQLAQIERVMQLLLDKEMYKAWIDAMNIKIKLTGTEAPQEVNVSAPFFQQYLEHKASLRLENKTQDLKELEPCEILPLMPPKEDKP